MKGTVFLGVDGGGTYTRAAIAGMDGTLHCCIDRNGAASIYKDPDAAENVRAAILEAVHAAGCDIGDIAGVTAGVAGLDCADDMEWARELTRIDGLTAVQQHVNDAEIAHCGAFRSKPGIIAISGTGSIIFGITESGRHLRNYDFNHYAAAAARHLVYDTVHKIIAGETDATDEELTVQVLRHFGVSSVRGLINLGATGFVADEFARDKLFGDFAPIVTEYALKGSRLAAQVCERAAESIATGIRLVGACFESDVVDVALIGSVAKSGYIYSKVDEDLGVNMNRVYIMQKTALPPVLGAVVMAMEYSGAKVSAAVLYNLGAGAGQA